jgi:predicted metal-dependent phosphoesterase TrpH
VLYRADFHIHTDYDELKKRRHGEKPDLLAAAIVESPLDVVAITEHNKISEKAFEVKAAIKALTSDIKRKILVLLGVELSVRYRGYPYHLGYIFEDEHDERHLPAIPPFGMDIVDLKVFRNEHPGVALLNHPALHEHRGEPHAHVTDDLVQKGLLEGVELLNGSILYNGADIKYTNRAFEAYLQARRENRNPTPIGSSDAHKQALIGSVWTEFYASCPEKVFDAIRSGNGVKARAGDPRIKTKLKSSLALYRGIRKFVGV